MNDASNIWKRKTNCSISACSCLSVSRWWPASIRKVAVDFPPLGTDSRSIFSQVPFGVFGVFLRHWKAPRILLSLSPFQINGEPSHEISVEFGEDYVVVSLLSWPINMHTRASVTLMNVFYIDLTSRRLDYHIKTSHGAFKATLYIPHYSAFTVQAVTSGAILEYLPCILS